MLRKQVDIAREEMLRHTIAPFRCVCGTMLSTNNRNGFAEHVATEVVIALERYALGNPESKPEPVTALARFFYVEGEAVRVDDVIGSQPLERRSMEGNRVHTHEVEVRTSTGGTRALRLTESEMNGFIESMAGKK